MKVVYYGGAKAKNRHVAYVQVVRDIHRMKNNETVLHRYTLPRIFVHGTEGIAHGNWYIRLTNDIITNI